MIHLILTVLVLTLLNTSPVLAQSDETATETTQPVEGTHPTPLSDGTGLVRNGNSADNRLGGTDSADYFNGAEGDDKFWGYLGRDVYVFAIGDGANTIYDQSVEGNLIKFRHEVALENVTFEDVDGEDGQVDRLITYSPNDSVLIVGWSELSQETQQAWTFEVLDAPERRAEYYWEVPDRSGPNGQTNPASWLDHVQRLWHSSDNSLFWFLAVFCVIWFLLTKPR